jgi:DNA topoisomerase II
MSSMKTKTIEETYVKKDPKQHIKDCPDTYVGSLELTEINNLWTFDEESKKIVKKDIKIIPGLYKIFDEILVNAYDHYVRSKNLPDSEQVTLIKVSVDAETNTISVYNNGEGIPAVMHKEHNKYVPELLFSDLLTSSNYDKNEKKITGGKNGLGSKLSAIFSTDFIIETVDSVNQKKYIQEFKQNNDIIGKPKITKSTGKPYTKITFRPDFKLLGKGEVNKLDADMINLFQKRVYDMTACTDSTVSIYWNDEKLNCKAFDKYVEFYIGPKTDLPRIHEVVNDRWEVIVSQSPDNNLEHVSFVNGINTFRGGEHLNFVATHIARKLNTYLKNRKTNKLDLKEGHLKDNMMIFLKCSIENPEFSSQTKEFMTTVSKNFGSKFQVSDAFIEKLAKTGIVERAQKLGEFKETINLDKTSTSSKRIRLDIPKYDSANWAGGPKSKECVLILTEGDSAKTSVDSGLSVIGKDRYGVFPLRGKLLNVRDANLKQLADNVEINHIRDIMGLQFYKKGTKQKMEYTQSLEGLNYGSIMIMCDQDLDGFHIKGLLVNYIGHFWPSLLEIPGFITAFKTPIVVATKKGHSDEKVSFFNLKNYLDWKEEVNLSSWTIKYYKGLGTSTKMDFKNYFTDFDNHYLEYHNDDGKANEVLHLAFSKSMADNRKLWLGNYDSNDIIDANMKKISYQDLINKELIHFSNYDNRRSIPNILDGLKPTQRKVMHYLLKINKKKDEIKVAQLAGSVAGKTDYHHGEVSMADTIVNMAQDFVGSNNINLLHPEGQFGSRRLNGKDSASIRYIYTYLSPITHTIYKQEDLPLLKYLEDDNGKAIEPEWFLPILPMVLVNGADGIGTGYSTFISLHNPLDIVDNLKRLMNGEAPIELKPWFRGFRGKIVQEENKSGSVIYMTYGEYAVIAPNTIRVSEIPLGMSIEKYKEHLLSLLIDNTEKDANKKNRQCLLDYQNNSTDSQVDFILNFSPAKFKTINTPAKLETILKMSSSNQTKDSYMHLFNKESKMTKYDSTLDILCEFYEVRLEYYQKRKDYLLDLYQKDLTLINEKIRFIELFISQKLLLVNKSDDIIMKSLSDNNFIQIIPNKTTKDDIDDDVDDIDNLSDNVSEKRNIGR